MGIVHIGINCALGWVSPVEGGEGRERRGEGKGKKEGEGNLGANE